MNITYISGIYDIYANRTFSNLILKNVTLLFKQPIHLVIYVDPIYKDTIENIEKSKTITIIYMPLSELTIYNLIIGKKDILKLPTHRNYEKDTCEYMALMNSKIELIQRSLPYIKTEYCGWIDAGISKIFKNIHTSFSNICTMNVTNIDTILNPGCYKKDLSFNDLCQTIWWNFLGGFFICNCTFVPTFYTQCLTAVHTFLDNGYIVWEVNVFCYIMKQYPETFVWYSGDHNDSLTNIPQQYILHKSIDNKNTSVNILQIPTFCINIEARKDRWDAMKERFKKYNIHAIQWRASTPDTVKGNYVHYLKGVQKACAYSHLRIYETMIKNNIEMAFILEDDASFRHDWMPIVQSKLSSIIKEDPEWDCIFLNVSEEIYPVETWTKIKDHCLAGGYIIHQRGAKFILEQFKDMYYCIDWMTQILQARGHSYSYFPWLIIQDGSTSNINDDKSGKMTPDYQKVIRLLNEANYPIENYE
jgi:GR25 family glycosyltransferase involved in LPS biosynthesis